jgi:DNA-binding transcriptional LysR family regulator
MRLFERTTHRVALTPAGQALLHHAKRLLTTAENAFADMRAAALDVASTVRIGAVPSMIPPVAQLLGQSSDDKPVSAHLHDGKSDDLIEGLRTGAHDIVICVATIADPDFLAFPIVHDEMMALVNVDHPTLRGNQIPWRALSGAEIVHFTGGGIGELTASALRQNGLAPSSRYQVDQLDSLYGLVLANLAVGIIPRLYTRSLDVSRLRLIQLARPIMRRPIKLLVRKQLINEHPVAHAFAMRLADGLEAIIRQ